MLTNVVSQKTIQLFLFKHVTLAHFKYGITLMTILVCSWTSYSCLSKCKSTGCGAGPMMLCVRGPPQKTAV